MLTVACFLFQRCYQSAGKQITHLNIADILKDAQITEFGIVTYFGMNSENLTLFTTKNAQILAF